MLSNDQSFELLKIVVSIAGGTLAGWVAVRLALSRFKEERRWERRLTSVADVLSALSEMKEIADEWQEEQFSDNPKNEEYVKERGLRYRLARRRFRDVAATASVLWPDNSLGKRIEQLGVELQQIDSRSDLDAMTRADEEVQLLQRAISQIAALARSTIQ